MTTKIIASRDRLVVRTLRCGRRNPGSNPGHGMRKKFLSYFDRCDQLFTQDNTPIFHICLPADSGNPFCLLLTFDWHISSWGI